MTTLIFIDTPDCNTQELLSVYKPSSATSIVCSLYAKGIHHSSKPKPLFIEDYISKSTYETTRNRIISLWHNLIEHSPHLTDFQYPFFFNLTPSIFFDEVLNQILESLTITEILYPDPSSHGDPLLFSTDLFTNYDSFYRYSLCHTVLTKSFERSIHTTLYPSSHKPIKALDNSRLYKYLSKFLYFSFPQLTYLVGTSIPSTSPRPLIISQYKNSRHILATLQKSCQAQPLLLSYPNFHSKLGIQHSTFKLSSSCLNQKPLNLLVQLLNSAHSAYYQSIEIIHSYLSQFTAIYTDSFLDPFILLSIRHSVKSFQTTAYFLPESASNIFRRRPFEALFPRDLDKSVTWLTSSDFNRHCLYDHLPSARSQTVGFCSTTTSLLKNLKSIRCLLPKKKLIFVDLSFITGLLRTSDPSIPLTLFINGNRYLTSYISLINYLNGRGDYILLSNLAEYIKPSIRRHLNVFFLPLSWSDLSHISHVTVTTQSSIILELTSRAVPVIRWHPFSEVANEYDYLTYMDGSAIPKARNYTELQNLLDSKLTTHSYSYTSSYYLAQPHYSHLS